MSNNGLDYLIVVHDRRGRGLRRYFGPFRPEGRATSLVEEINGDLGEREPKLEGSGEPAITAGIAWLHPPDKAIPAEILEDPPHPDTGVHPGQEDTP